MYQFSRKSELLLISIVVVILLMISIFHVLQGPYPTVWDDANYAVNTFEWIKTIREKGLVYGLYIGLARQLPEQYPPMVFITSVVGGLIGKSLAAMRLSHLFWFVITLWATFRIGKQINGFSTGILSVLIVGTMPPIFYWSQMIMGEPALFATLSLCLLLLIEWGDRMKPIQGAIFGAILGLGLLSKQHFWLIMIMPISIWLVWIFRYYSGMADFRSLALTMSAFVGGILVVAGPWYLLHFKPLLDYALQPDFKPHLLGPNVSLTTLSAQAVIVIGNVGVVGSFISLIGLSWGVKSILTIMKCRTSIEWKYLTPLLLLAAALVNIFAAINLRSSNPRFFAPALLPLGILAAIVINNLLMLNRKIGLPVMLLVVGLHFLSWIHLCFGVNTLKNISFQQSWAQPQDVAPLINAIDFLSSQIDSAQGKNIKLLGATNIFNPPLVQAIVLEKGYSWKVAPVYRWSEDGITGKLYERLQEAEFLLVQRHGGVGTPMLSKHNAAAIEIIENNPTIFHKVWSMKSKTGHNEIEIYKKRSSVSHSILTFPPKTEPLQS